MKPASIPGSFCALFSIFCLLALAIPSHAVGTFSTANTPPDFLGHMLLMPDGTVIAPQLYAEGNAWYQLTPDLYGNYADGLWSPIASANFSRLYFASAVLKDGRAFVAGGEYGSGGVTAEIYNPSNNTWTVVSPPTSLVNSNQISPDTGTPQRIADAECKVLPDGQVLIIPPDPKNFNGTLLFDPVTTNWSAGPSTINFLGEASLVKIPDGSMLSVDADLSSSERYLPAANVWTNDAATPISLWALLGPDFVGETGPAFLLPNGHAIFFGGSGHTALYTPSGGNNPGTWVQGPDIPGGNVTADAPGAMLVNGKILVATAAPPFVQNVTNVIFPSPTTFYEYDYSVGTTGVFTQVTGFAATNFPTYQGTLLDLPDGTVFYNLWNNFGMYVYQPDGSPLAAGKPTILSISTNGNGSLHFTGFLFNGISEGAAYGDDHQMDGNFPLVRFTDAFGFVSYGRTFNWSSTGVMTGAAIATMDCQAPAGSSPQDLIQVVVNGIASDSVNLILNPVVTTINDSGAGSLRQVVSNALSGAKITFAPGLSGQTITLTSGELPLFRSVTIDASALLAGIKINGNHNSRIFNVAGGATVTLNSLTITNGFTNGASGGGILNSGTLSLASCTLMGNTTDASDAGGAIYNNGTLTLTGCTLAGNSGDFAGALQNNVTCSLVNCTFASNSAPGGNGGAIDNVAGSLTATQCTFSGNSAGFAGGAIDNYQAQAQLANCIVANNGGDGDIYNWTSGTLILAGNNLVKVFVNEPGGTFTPEGAILSSDPMLGPLANNGGPTLTMMPQIGSPAVDAGLTSSASGIAFDQRGPGFPRVVGPVVDLGAVETPVPLSVFTAADSGYGSLRYAVTYATNNSAITFAPALSGQIITLTSGEMTVNQNLMIDGSSLSRPLQLNGNNSSSIFDISATATVTLNSLVLTNGNAGVNNGGAIQVENGGSLTVNNCTLAGNNALQGFGGAIFNFGNLTMTGCTLSGNSGWYAGGIENEWSCALVNCTLANNSAVNDGGAFENFGGGLALLQCTLSGNSAGAGDYGFDDVQGNVDVDNTIVANNNGIDILALSGSTITFDGTNIGGLVENDGTDTETFNGGVISLNPLLGPLANNGGPTLTMLPQTGSPAIDAGLTSDAAGVPYDQRGPGFLRVSGRAVDVGAVEVQSAAVASTPYLITGDLLTNGTFGFSFTNVPGVSFSIFATTNLELPLSNWSNLGPAVESPLGSGQFHFTDPQAGTSVQRFYRVRSP